MHISQQTSTQVHSMEAMAAQRHAALAREQATLTGLSLYGQVILGLALYVYDHVSTPGYLSVLLTLPAALAAALLCLALTRRAPQGQPLLSWALGKGGGKLASLMLSAVFWLDGQVAVYGLTAVVQDVLPNMSGLGIALAVALMMALALGSGEDHALPRLARLMGWGLPIAFLLCFAMALSQGKGGHLFPLLGFGGSRILRGGLWLGGCLAGVCCPLVLPQPSACGPALAARPALLLRPLLLAMAAAALTALFSAFLLPVYALARPETLGWRLLLVTHVSPSLAGWSLFLWAMLFLLLITLAAGVSRAACLMAWAVGKPAPSRALIGGLLLLQLPAAAFNGERLEGLLERAAPWRGPVTLGVLLALLLGALLKRGRAEKSKEAAP